MIHRFSNSCLCPIQKYIAEMQLLEFVIFLPYLLQGEQHKDFHLQFN